MEIALFTIILMFSLFIMSGRARVDYCEPSLTCPPPRGKNSVCLYGCKPGKGVTPIDPDFAFRNDCLYWHNWHRSELAAGKVTIGGNGAASNIRVLSYDMDLEFTAACWIYYRGVMEHDRCRITPRFNTAGQNLWRGTTVNIRHTGSMEHVVWTWFREHQDSVPEILESFQHVENVKIGHFTQLVWATTTHVGCGRCTIQGDNQIGYVGCNYGPGGNIIGAPAYKKGPGASACPNDTKPNEQFPLLCGEIEPWTEDAKLVGNRQLNTASDLFRKSDLRCSWSIILFTLLNEIMYSITRIL